MQLAIKLRGLVEGEASGPLLVYPHPLSFYGEVDPKTGRLPDGRSMSGRVLVIPATRGSTVGSYVIYAMKEYGTAPAAIVAVEAEPILVAGAVMAGIPLAHRLPRDMLEKLVQLQGCRAKLYSNPPQALLEVECRQS